MQEPAQGLVSGSEPVKELALGPEKAMAVEPEKPTATKALLVMAIGLAFELREKPSYSQ